MKCFCVKNALDYDSALLPESSHMCPDVKCLNGHLLTNILQYTIPVLLRLRNYEQTH